MGKRGTQRCPLIPLIEVAGIKFTICQTETKTVASIGIGVRFDWTYGRIEFTT